MVGVINVYLFYPLIYYATYREDIDFKDSLSEDSYKLPQLEKLLLLLFCFPQKSEILPPVVLEVGNADIHISTHHKAENL